MEKAREKMKTYKRVLSVETLESRNLGDIRVVTTFGTEKELIERSAYTKAIEALKEWRKFEREQIAKEGPYVGKRINELITMTEKTLKELGEI